MRQFSATCKFLHALYLEDTRLGRASGDLCPVLMLHVPPAYVPGEEESGFNSSGRQVALPDPGERLAGASPSDVLAARGSSRDFGKTLLSDQDVSAYMFATCGQTGTSAASANVTVAFFSTPSAGSLRNARHLIAAWRDDYHLRPHSRLGGHTVEVSSTVKTGPDPEQRQPINADSKDSRSPGRARHHLPAGIFEGYVKILVEQHDFP